MAGNKNSGRKASPSRQRKYTLALRLRNQGLSLAQIGNRLGLTKQGTENLLKYYSKNGKTPGCPIFCRRCRREIVRGGDWLRKNSKTHCLKCLARNPKVSFGERLRAFRLAAGVTQAKLANKIGVVTATINAYENNYHDPHWKALVKLMGVFGRDLLTLGFERKGNRGNE